MTDTHQNKVWSLPDFAMVGVVVVAIGFAYWGVFTGLLNDWASNPDMSHGYFVPVVALWLLWLRSEMAPKGESLNVGWSWVLAGSSVVVLGATLRIAGILFRSTTVEAWSLIPIIAGLVIAFGGWKGIRWAWPSVFFLVFMLPLPAALGGMLKANLQSIATTASCYSLQVLGIPAIAEGNIIWLSSQAVGVAEACNGLRMLTSFFAISVAACFVLDRPVWQKIVLVLSAPMIGVIANTFRITLTGVVYEQGVSKSVSEFVHDFAGWIMMPLAIAILMVELWVLAGLVLPEESGSPYEEQLST